MIVLTGSIALDTTRTPFETIEKALGGSATFFAYASSFFHETAVVSVVGADFPEKHWQTFRERGVNVDGVEHSKGKTFFIDWNYDYDLYARKTNRIELNCLENYEPVVPEPLKKAEYVYLGTNPPSQQLAVLEQMDSPRFALMDTIEYYIETARSELTKAFKAVDGVLLNDVEARMYAKTPNLVKAAKTIMGLGVKLVLIKKGEHGCMLFKDDLILPLPAFPLEEVVDPTGAGDSFGGGFLGHLARKGRFDEKALKEAMAYGHVMGSFAVEGFGLDGLRKASHDSIEDRYRKYREMILF